jgi:4-aminobutyrate aminotransferase-like enzyme
VNIAAANLSKSANLLNKRRHLLGPNTPLFYERPVHIVRGSGLFFGSELVHKRIRKTQAPAEARRVLNALRDNGVLIGLVGRYDNLKDTLDEALARP